MIEYAEFVDFYNASTVAEKKKIRALKAHHELLRRLESGGLTPDEERVVRQRLGLQGTAGEDAAAAKQQAAARQKVSEQKQMSAAASELERADATTR